MALRCAAFALVHSEKSKKIIKVKIIKDEEDLVPKSRAEPKSGWYHNKAQSISNSGYRAGMR